MTSSSPLGGSTAGGNQGAVAVNIGRAALIWRVAPPAALGLGRGRRLIERNLRVVRRTWWVPASGLAEPVFYLLSIGIGIGKLVGRLPGPGGRSVSYAVYVAPALLAAAAMNGAVYESTFNVYFKLKYARIYDAVLVTPLGARDVARGEIATALMRGSLYSAVFVTMMAALGDVASAWAALALPAAVLIGFAFSAMGMAATTYMRGWTDFDLVQLVLLPLFLFSTTFYPLSIYPRWLQIVVELTPLFHGVAMCRALTLGAPGLAVAGHAAYLSLLGIGGVAVASRRIRRLLLS
jgi:lipooligosaccharide transport system permease protein